MCQELPILQLPLVMVSLIAERYMIQLQNPILVLLSQTIPGYNSHVRLFGTGCGDTMQFRTEDIYYGSTAVTAKE